VVTASRQWICVRPATYESAPEAKVLLGYFEGREGALENTVFALLDSSGKMLSYRAGRSPGMVYGDATKFAAALVSHGKEARDSKTRALPQIANLKLAMNIAACDSVPLVIGIGETQAQRTKLERELATAAWDKRLVGQAHYVVCEPKAMAAFPDLLSFSDDSSTQVLMVDPDDYGTRATLLAQHGAGDSKLTDSLVEASDRFLAVARDHRKHVSEGHKQGLEWKGEIETTDPDDVRRSKKGRKSKERGERRERKSESPR
jgi:hypothetical protein